MTCFRRTDSVKDDQQTRVAAARERLENLKGMLPDGLAVEIRVAIGRPAEEIAALASQERVGLIAMVYRRAQSCQRPRADLPL